jgi:tetratricopeptide (TPR) repeat protein
VRLLQRPRPDVDVALLSLGKSNGLFHCPPLCTLSSTPRPLPCPQRARALLTACGDVGTQVAATLFVAGAFQAQGDYGRAIALLEQNIAALASGVTPVRERLAVASRSWLARCLAERGDFPAGIARGEEGLRLAEAADDAYVRVDASPKIGLLYLRKGDLHKAIPVLERGLALCRAPTSPSCSPKLPRPWARRIPSRGAWPKPCRCWNTRCSRRLA